MSSDIPLDASYLLWSEAGFVDLLTLVRFTQFAGLQTGNMILIGRDLYRLSQPMQERLKEASQALSTYICTPLGRCRYTRHFIHVYSNSICIYMLYTYNI